MKTLTKLLALTLVVTAFAGCTTPGGIDTDNPGGGNGNPDAPLKPKFTATPDAADPLLITFDASGSDGNPDLFRWDFGDGETGNGKTITHTYARTNGKYHVTLTVGKGDGETVSDRDFVTVGTGLNQAPVAAFTINSQWLTTTDSFVVNASGSSDPDSDPLTYTWSYSPLVAAGGGHAHGGSGSDAPPAIPPASTDLGRLNSGALTTGKSWEVTLTEKGVYLMHCHPHPDMKQNVTVSDTATLGGNGVKVYVDIYELYFAPENLAVKPGTKVVYTNRGAVPHTATQEGFRTLAGTGMGATFTIPTKGAYDVILSVKDAKGAVTETRIPVISTDSLPDGKLVLQDKGNFPVAAPDRAEKVLPVTLKYNVTDLLVNLTYASPVPGLNKLVLELYKTDVNGDPLFTGGPAGSTAQSIATGPLPAGTYVVRVTGETGANVDFTIDVLGTYVLKPRPEDFAMAAPPPAGGDDHSGH